MTRAPSTRYPTFVLAGDGLQCAGGRHHCPTLTDAVGLASMAGEESVVWVHESAHAAAIFDLETLEARTLTAGWRVIDRTPKIHVSLPALSGNFAGADNGLELWAALEMWRRHVGLVYLFSGASTVHKLIRGTTHLPSQHTPPELPGYTATAWSVPANTWAPPGVLETLAASGRQWVRCLDRAGSFLSAWRGCALPAGPWTHVGRCRALPGGETAKPAGYWLIDPDHLPDPGGLFDPWRRHTDPAGPRWLTTPLVQLAADLSGEPVEALEGWWAADKCRALDPAAGRLADARLALADIDTPAARLALAALKDGYAGATAWFEYGPRHPDPLGRPAWRHTILDRYAANTYRALAAATPGPFAVTEIDCALFALDNPEQIPDGLRTAPALGGWKPKGHPVPIDTALAAHTDGGPRSVIALAEGAIPCCPE